MPGSSEVPDSWEDTPSNDVPTSAFSNLNVAAKPFQFNLNSAEFVPGGAWTAPAPVAAPVENISVDEVQEAQDCNTKEVVEEQAPEPVVEQAIEPVEEVKQSEEATAEVTPVVVPKVEEGPIVELKKEDYLNVVFVGHVDAGKSTLGGQIMFLTGMVDKRTLEKYEREAKEKNRETWYLSWALDTNQEERDKGKTVEVGRAFFRTENRHFTILDAPGHRSFVPNMIGGTSQADIAVLVISARKGEFETGFERGGQTREHAVLVKVSGVSHLVVLINKMDDTTVQWSKERYDYCVTKLSPFLKKIGFRPGKDVHFMPCSGFTGANLNEGQPENHPWYTGLPFIPYLDQLPNIKRDCNGPVRLPIVDRYKDMGTIVLGKLESGVVAKSQYLVMQPNGRKVKVSSVLVNDEEVASAQAGENCKLKLDDVDIDEISKGFVLCSPDNLCAASAVFDAQIMIYEYKSIISAGFKAIMHLHSVVEEVTIEKLLYTIDRKTGSKKKVAFVKQDQTVVARLRVSGPICVETFKNMPKMARLALRDENITIALGKVLKVQNLKQ